MVAVLRPNILWAANITADFNEKVSHSDDDASKSTQLNIEYFILQDVINGLWLKVK